MRARERASASSSSEAADESDGEIIRAAEGVRPASTGIGWCGQVER